MSAPTRPACPRCGSDELLQVDHGYHMAPLVWSDSFCEWIAEPDRYVMGWNGTDSYHQCDSCSWQCQFSDLPCPAEDTEE